MTEAPDIANLKLRLRPLYSKVFHHRPEAPILFLDVGCGFGSMLAAAAEQFDLAVGVNTDCAELQNAAVWLESHDIRNVLLVRASAQKLPFIPRQFLAVTCVQVLEHVRDPQQALAELGLALSTGGALYLSLPNRYTLRREPHMKLWGIGYMPRRILTWYLTHRKKMDIYRSVNLLSPRQVSAWLEHEFGNSYEFIRSGYHNSMLGRLASQAWHLPIASQLARNTVGDIEALAWR
jgi:SAM-dependent methyltransferase